MKKILLLLILALGLFGAESEEIGKPYVDKSEGFIQSAVLAPDGESFYTLKGDLITQWQLSSLKRLNSFKIDIDSKVGRFGYQISVTSDGKKMILRSSEDIMFVNLDNNNLNKKIKYDSDMGVISGTTFISISSKDRKVTDRKSVV